jgi:hypothetical protein
MYIFSALIIIWSLWGYLLSKTEQAQYTVVRQARGYEIRAYPAHVVAQATVRGSYDEALREGFRIIAAYIFGGNAARRTVPMTVPAVIRKNKKETIAMTAPVRTTIDGESHTVSFGMPRSYTLTSLPAPVDRRVELVTVPEKKMAAIRFSWFRSARRIQSKKLQLVGRVRRDNLHVTGAARYAGYDAPWTPPWMTRNEVMVEVL